LLAIAAIWNDRLGSALIGILAQFGAVVSLIAEQALRPLDPADQAFCDRAVGRLTSGQRNGDPAPISICECVDIRVAPSARATNSLLSAPLFRPMRCDVREVDHLRVRRSTVAGELPEQVFPYAAPCPPSEAIVYRRRRPVGFGTIRPAAAAFQHVYNTADDAPIVLSPNTTHIGWQVGVDPLPLLVAPPKESLVRGKWMWRT